MFSLTEHKSWTGFLGQPGRPEDTVALATILGSVYVSDSIAKSGRNIAAEIRRGNHDLMEEISRSSSAITTELQSMGGDLRQMGATLEWGLNDLLKENRQMNQTLEDLLKTAKSPSQTWAFEQFDMAREAYSRGLDKEALEFVNNAINGFQGQTGNRLDHRFHFFKGTVLLGNKEHHDPEIVDVKAAKQCFEDAARYAAGSKDEETRLFAAEAYCHAAFAAYCLDDVDAVASLCKQAVTIDPELAEGYYLIAKVSSRQGNESLAFQSVRKALDIDPAYILKFSMDKDFSGTDVVDKAENDHVSEQSKRIETALGIYKDLKNYTEIEIQEPELQFQNGEGALEASVRIQNIGIACHKVLVAFREKLLEARNKAGRIAASVEVIAENAPKRKGIPPQLFAVIGAVLGFMVGLSGGFFNALLFMVVFAVVGSMLAGVLNANTINNKVREAEKARADSDKVSEDVEQRFQKALALKERVDEVLGTQGMLQSEHSVTAS